MKPAESFFQGLDKEWGPLERSPIPFHIIGASALALQGPFDRGTKDSDILETKEIEGEVGKRLLTLGGKNSSLHKKHHIYIDIVKGPIPFLPQKPVFHLLPQFESLKNFSIHALDAIDIVVSKLKRFNANDVSDIRFMATHGLLSHERLVERFQAAVNQFSTDARAEDPPIYVKHLNTVERDILLVPESDIELPSWI